MDLSKEEIIEKLNLLITEGESLFRTVSYQRENLSFDIVDSEPITDYYTVVDDKRYPTWRTKSLAFLENILDASDTSYIHTFRENCESAATEHNLNNGIGVLKALKSAYEDGTFKDKKKTMDDSSQKYPKKYWHCAVRLLGQKDYSVVNNLTFEDLKKRVIEPWKNSKTFNIDGKIVNNRESLEEIKITQTNENQEYYEQKHTAQMRAAHVFVATDVKMLPIEEGTDYTQELLFENSQNSEVELHDPSLVIVERVCERIAKTANSLKNRRPEKKAFEVEDEYDVQDLLQATLKAFVKHSVQENPLPKIAGNSSRADITIEDLGLIIEIKYVRGPNDQKKMVDDFAKDLMLYSRWEYLKEFYYLIYNSDDLQDSEALEELNGPKELNGKKFNCKVILA